MAPQDAPAAGWGFHTNLRKPVGKVVIGFAATIAALGFLVFGALVYDFKMVRAIDELQSENAQLSEKLRSVVKQQAELDEIVARVGDLSAERPRVLQLQALSRLASSGAVGDPAKVALVEWEYRNERVRMLFSVPQEKFVLSDFLLEIEKTGVFSEVRLLPGTPSLTVGLQAGLKQASPISTLPPLVDSGMAADATSVRSSDGRP
ncbi:MAG: hypothetical protein KF686_09185 [Ramlibacter sp.]|nr:hypothetical protein [Ramlibacter sp.]